MTTKELIEKRDKFKEGMVVYYLSGTPWNRRIEIGVVIEKYKTEVWINKLERRFNRRIMDMPSKDFEAPSEWFKVPKDYKDLFARGFYQFDKTEYVQLPSDLSSLKNTNREDIQLLYEKKYLMPVEEQDHRQFEIQYEPSKGWRLVQSLRLFYQDRIVTDFSLTFDKVFLDYNEVKQLIDYENKELERQAALTDEEWAMEQLENKIDEYQKLLCLSLEERNKVLQRFIDCGIPITEIDVRIDRINKQLQYKKEKNTKWLNLVLNDVFLF